MLGRVRPVGHDYVSPPLCALGELCMLGRKCRGETIEIGVFCVFECIFGMK